MTGLIYLYVTIFTVFYIIFAFANIKTKRKVRDKYTSKDSNFCIVVYACGEAGYLENLIKQLKNQSYPEEKYSIYVVLDKVENPPQFIFETDLGINVLNINNIEPIGKSQAYSIFAEKFSDVPNLDGYIFMDAKSYIDNDFLENANYYSTKYKVFIPMIECINSAESLKFWDNVKLMYSRYIYKFIYKARTKLGLTNLINTDTFVINRDLLNKIGSFDFRDKISETNYTLKLAKENVATAFIDDIKVYRDINDIELRTPSLSKRIGIFWHNITKCKNFKTFEYVLSLITPNWLIFLLIYLMLISHTAAFGSFSVLGLFKAGYDVLLITFILFILAFSASLLNAGIYSKDYFYLFAYPIYSIGHIIINFPPVRAIRNFIKNKNRHHNIEKMMTDIIVTDGQKDYYCKVELISDDGLARVKFINKKKTYTTNNHLRMVDALKELSQKLSDYGMTLKICQNCKYFQPTVDGSTNMVKGVCLCKFEGRVEGDILPTLIWNTCPNFEKINVVNLF
jgi:hypothetical protein